jgi:RNA recognition motif-containing protein
MGSKVFVGNLDYNTRREEVQNLFAEVGTIRDVFLPTDRETGRPRGFAFVEYENEADAAKAIERFNGYQLGGRALRVNAAEDRPRTGGPGGPRRPGGGGGGYRGGGPGGGPRGDFDFSGGGGGMGGGDYTGDYPRNGGGGPGGKAKGSRRNLRAKKRSL